MFYFNTVDFRYGYAFRGQESELNLFVSDSLRRGWRQFIAATAEALRHAIPAGVKPSLQSTRKLLTKVLLTHNFIYIFENKKTSPPKKGTRTSFAVPP